MTTKQLFKKLEAAREIAEMTPTTANFAIYCEIDGFTLEQNLAYSKTIWFKTWKDFIKAVKYDWNSNIVEIIENGELKSETYYDNDWQNRGRFIVDNDQDIIIKIGVCN